MVQSTKNRGTNLLWNVDFKNHLFSNAKIVQMEPSSLRAFLCILCEVPSEENLLAVDVTVFKAAIALKGGKFSRSDTSRNATIVKR